MTIAPVERWATAALCDGSSPVWLDERRLVIAVDRGRSRNETTALAVIAVDDPWPTLRLAAGHGDRGEAKVSPDAPVSRRRCSTATTSTARASTSPTSPRASTSTVAGTPARNVRVPAWSPDGRMLAYADETPGWYEVFVVSADGSPPAPAAHRRRRRLRRAALVARRRSRILAVRYRHGVGDLVVIDPATGAVDVLAPGGTWSSPDWLADGAVVAVHESHTHRPRLVPHRRRRGRRAARPDSGGGQGGAARRPRTCHLPLARRYRGLRLALPPRRGLGRPPGAGDRLPARRPDVATPATSGTASPSTSSTRAMPGSRSTSAAARRTAGTSSGRTTACGASTTRRTASPPTTTWRRSAGSTRRVSASSAPATARTWRCWRSSTTSGTASPAPRPSMATATSSRRGRRATSSAASTSSG